MKIFICGAGIIGSVYAAKIQKAGNQVTLLARGARYDELSKNGISLKKSDENHTTTTQVLVTTNLECTDYYDLIIIAVRLDQLDALLPIIAANTVCTLVMLLLNYPDNTKDLQNALKPKHILLGFPGIGGYFKGRTIIYLCIKQQHTTLGEISDLSSDALKTVRITLEKAGFAIEINNNMESWLKVHAVFISCITASIVLKGGDSILLGKSRSSIVELVTSIKEGFKALKGSGYPIKPDNLNLIFLKMPLWFSVRYWQWAMQNELGTQAIAPHAQIAKAEMQLLSQKVLSFLGHSFPTPTLNGLLLRFINTAGRGDTKTQ